MEFFKKVVFSTLYGTISQSKPHAVAYRGSRDDGGGHPPPAPCMRLVSNVRVVERSGLVVRDAYIRDKPPGCLERVR